MLATWQQHVWTQCSAPPPKNIWWTFSVIWAGGGYILPFKRIPIPVPTSIDPEKVLSCDAASHAQVMESEMVLKHTRNACLPQWCKVFKRQPGLEHPLLSNQSVNLLPLKIFNHFSSSLPKTAANISPFLQPERIKLWKQGNAIGRALLHMDEFPSPFKGFSHYDFLSGRGHSWWYSTCNLINQTMPDWRRSLSGEPDLWERLQCYPKADEFHSPGWLNHQPTAPLSYLDSTSVY